MGLMLKKPEGSAGSAWPAILVGLFVAFGGVLYGSVIMEPYSQAVFNSITDMILVPLAVSWVCHIGGNSFRPATSMTLITCRMSLLAKRQ
jgi:hypothetical protein